MEITKVNESYNITDKTDLGWSLSGSVYSETSGSLNINAEVYNELGEHIGSMSYYKPLEGKVNFSINVNESNRDDFSNYADTVVDTVLKKFE